MNNDFDLSVVIPTLGRTEELSALLKSLIQCDSFKELTIEVIIVDQNEQDILEPIIKDFSNVICLRHERVRFKGLSKAKNYGVNKSRGKIVCFPDDDSEFSRNTLKKAFDLMQQTGCDALFGKTIDKITSRDSVINYEREATWLTLKHFEGCFVEATMFAKRQIFDLALFDEQMGVGCLYGAHEGYDFVYRLLLMKTKLYYSPELLFFHPQKISMKESPAEIRRAFFYSCGFGYLSRKHNFRHKIYKRLISLLLYFPFVVLFRHKQTKYFSAQIFGLFLGYKVL